VTKKAQCGQKVANEAPHTLSAGYKAEKAELKSRLKNKVAK
jgi:hypothetical protein